MEILEQIQGHVLPNQETGPFAPDMFASFTPEKAKVLSSNFDTKGNYYAVYDYNGDGIGDLKFSGSETNPLKIDILNSDFIYFNTTQDGHNMHSGIQFIEFDDVTDTLKMNAGFSIDLGMGSKPQILLMDIEKDFHNHEIRPGSAVLDLNSDGKYNVYDSDYLRTHGLFGYQFYTDPNNPSPNELYQSIFPMGMNKTLEGLVGYDDYTHPTLNPQISPSPLPSSNNG